MANDSSFDVVSKLNLQEVDNGVNQAVKEIQTRFDFRGSKTEITLSKEKKEITIVSDDEFRLKMVIDILESKLLKRGIPSNALNYGKVEPASQMAVRQAAKFIEGIDQEKAKEIVKVIKALNLKVNPTIQGDQVRVTAKSKDDLQTVMAHLRGYTKVPLQFTNFK
ncbi:MAG: YajQ family cyclic di-GMP-binding protein [Candidatus Firestonebacteria bacterium RIFOXYC2_FULL_39_67]|nr:MAG: YajQ family cyclic di-GMP-binding protein [Candidatus Firestonebacteria bacterium RIFOXYD2_FULL_39_29]OGF56593.1 MAG: YajQ family cyclic di-GMP-binding protein [Candidatus Firestonebacteria bacterium RIFOXYC2_FULL_39_67]OGF57873.1 MAG: YajQ family cyclic di-GMP-binding protein [Candidatus Firestonebacteria bacterium RifOxyC12_full_39_7]